MISNLNLYNKFLNVNKDKSISRLKTFLNKDVYIDVIIRNDCADARISVVGKLLDIKEDKLLFGYPSFVNDELMLLWEGISCKTLQKDFQEYVNKDDINSIEIFKPNKYLNYSEQKKFLGKKCKLINFDGETINVFINEFNNFDVYFTYKNDNKEICTYYPIHFLNDISIIDDV